MGVFFVLSLPVFFSGFLAMGVLGGCCGCGFRFFARVAPRFNYVRGCAGCFVCRRVRISVRYLVLVADGVFVCGVRGSLAVLVALL